MRYLLTILILALAAGCCSAPTFTEKSVDLVNKNAEAWDRAHTLTTLLDQTAELDGKTGAAWQEYVVRAEANAIVLQHKAAGTKITYAEALAQAREVSIP